MSELCAKIILLTNRKEVQMGHNTASDLANLSDYGIELSYEDQIAIHLTSNHYPPVPTSMVQPCIQAINAYNNDEPNLEIELPEPVEYKGRNTAPAWAIVEQHHLEAWLDQDDYYDEEYIDYYAEASLFGE